MQPGDEVTIMIAFVVDSYCGSQRSLGKSEVNINLIFGLNSLLNVDNLIVNM